MYKPSRNDIKLDKGSIARLEESIVAIHTLYNDCLLEVSVFGSYAKGTPKKYSSIDLLIVVEEAKERFMVRNANLQRLLNGGEHIIQIDPLVYTEEELLDLIKKKESFIDSILKETVVVWNGFNEIDLEDLVSTNQIPSRYVSAIPDLEDVI